VRHSNINRRMSALGHKRTFSEFRGSSASKPHSNESPSLSVSVSGKRDFSGQRQRRRKGPSRSSDRQLRQKPPHENPPIRHYLHDTGKSLFVWDCVVGLRGLELPTNRLSAARSEHRAMGHLVGFRAIGREVGALFLRVALLCRKKNPRPRMETISDRVSARDAKENLVTIMEDYRG
jgi:hypothetical protein